MIYLYDLDEEAVNFKFMIYAEVSRKSDAYYKQAIKIQNRDLPHYADTSADFSRSRNWEMLKGSHSDANYVAGVIDQRRHAKAIIYIFVYTRCGY